MTQATKLTINAIQTDRPSGYSPSGAPNSGNRVSRPADLSSSNKPTIPVAAISPFSTNSARFQQWDSLVFDCVQFANPANASKRIGKASQVARTEVDNTLMVDGITNSCFEQAYFADYEFIDKMVYKDQFVL